MSLTVEARHRLGHFSLEAAFTSEGGVTALFGRSGSGKTSLIRIIAGLTRPTEGRVVLDGDVLADTARRIFLPPHRRRFGYVFQEARLFPHLTVRQNLHYGRWFSPKGARTENPDRIIGLLGIGDLLDRQPANLSGGEKQRVAIGRALLSSPRLLLMDEPLAALDDERKAEILPYLERLRDEVGIPIVYVSHSVAEVARLADKVVLMADGRIAAAGPASDVLGGARLSSALDRREAGSVLSGRVEARDAAHGLATIRLDGGAAVFVPGAAVSPGEAVRLRIPARDVLVATVRPEGISALNILEGVVETVEPDGEGMANLRIACGGDHIHARITVLSVERLGLAPGLPVHAVVKTVALE
ncbi:molybdenum ABC transporter ATP-binding protein [Shinella zoogloeoides]|uniref:Molybdenum ABC transporter ATP-binding protein n=1 Tax=Shinella zoogloeoides TaxID=352475 RepID=A0A6N8TJZ4_SHIZO|nr:molybdenum ABC transporter ATP-binding protein [Shinella zoogloeoides]MXO02576.1 molybdenum ABC transporter ATP-binding protein [Shinella zoogloeoides]UEX82274.1 molybdenum ABC transporter ATP-binding protein [Shinella zoogloeoides]